MKGFYVTLCQLLTCLSHHSSVVNIIILIGCCNLDMPFKLHGLFQAYPIFLQVCIDDSMEEREARRSAWSQRSRDVMLYGCGVDVVDVVMSGGCGDVGWKSGGPQADVRGCEWVVNWY